MLLSPGVKSFAASVMSIKPQLTKEGWGEGEREDKANGGGGSNGYRAAPRRAVACASQIVAELWSITTAHNRAHTTPRSSAPLLEAPAGVRPSL